MTQSITSDRDYLEIVTDGDITISTSGSDADGTAFSTARAGTNNGVTTITHSIGSIPIVRAFYDPAKNGTLYNCARYNNIAHMAYDDPWLITVSTTTTTKLIIESNSAQTNIPVYYRIYRFGNNSITSDERIDKIFSVDYDNEIVAAAASSDSPVRQTNTIPHGQTAAPLWTLEFSLDQSSWHSEGSLIITGPDTASGPPGGPYARYFYTTAYGSSDATNFYISYINNNLSSQTIYSRYALDYKS